MADEPRILRTTEPHLWLVGKVPAKTWKNYRETSQRKSRTHSYDELYDLLMELAMEKESDESLTQQHAPFRARCPDPTTSIIN